jgi:hypothetical protein
MHRDTSLITKVTTSSAGTELLASIDFVRFLTLRAVPARR